RSPLLARWAWIARRVELAKAANVSLSRPLSSPSALPSYFPLWLIDRCATIHAQVAAATTRSTACRGPGRPVALLGPTFSGEVAGFGEQRAPVFAVDGGDRYPFAEDLPGWAERLARAVLDELEDAFARQLDDQAAELGVVGRDEPAGHSWSLL